MPLAPAIAQQLNIAFGGCIDLRSETNAVDLLLFGAELTLVTAGTDLVAFGVSADMSLLSTGTDLHLAAIGTGADLQSQSADMGSGASGTGADLASAGTGAVLRTAGYGAAAGTGSARVALSAEPGGCP
jgi:hypothetical protein